MKLVLIPRSTLKFKSVPQLPGAVLGTSPIVVTAAGLKYTVSLNLPVLLTSLNAYYTPIASPSTDKAVVRFNGALGAIQNSTAIISDVGTLSLTVSSGVNRGLLITQAAASGAASNPTLNAINIADSIDAGTGVVDGLAIYHGFGTSAAKGSRQGLQVTLDLTAATNAANAARYYVSGMFLSKATSSDGGGVGTEKGAIGSLNPVCWFTGSATNMAEGNGGEVNTQWETGSSGLDKYGWKVVQTALDKVAGSRNDAAFFACNQAGAVGWGALIQFGDALNSSPLKTTGSIMALKGGHTAAFGIDLSNWAFTGAAFKSQFFQVAGTGVVTESANAAAAPTPPAGTMLHLNQVDGASAAISLNAYGAACSLNLTRANNTGASPSVVASGNNIALLNYRGWDSSVYATAVTFRGVATETWSATAHGTLFDILTTPNTTVAQALALRVNQSGGVWVGATGADPGIGAIGAEKAILSIGATSGIGYGTGAGGAVTQLTSRTTGVTLNTVCGEITLFSQVNSAVSGATAQTFTVTNSAVAAADMVHVCQKSGTDKYLTFVTNVSAGSFQITNFTTGGTTNEAPKFSFAVIKAVTA